MKTRLLLPVFFLSLMLGCSDNDDQSMSCLNGESLAYNCCAGVTLINVSNKLLMGKPYVMNNITYPNVIQVPGNYPPGELHFNARTYVAETDAHAGECLCLISAPLDLPIYTITSTSPFACD